MEEDAEDDPEEDLPLHPKPYLVPCAEPEIQEIGLMLRRSYDAQKVVPAGLCDREIE